MSPFARLLRDLRLSRKLRQSELASLIGYDQTYISALEVDLKGPPTPEFVDRLIGTLHLSAIETAELRRLARASRRKYVIDGEAPEHVFLLLDLLFEKLSDVTPAQSRVIKEVLNMPSPADEPEEQPRRRRRARQTEVHM
jgi:transcriptional regulator with XRE-family HTH domain